MGLGDLEYTRKLWVEELETAPDKTTITQGKINKLNKFIDRIYAASSKVRRIEEAAEQFTDEV